MFETDSMLNIMITMSTEGIAVLSQSVAVVVKHITLIQDNLVRPALGKLLYYVRDLDISILQLRSWRAREVVSKK